ncbi:cytochrome c oxidase-assembly factor COX23, mitochondrial [Morus notabilis]|uniref:cytochrome c oxidase-assembly factor COX23, mitochondrial n=1 Tax=Morus notabilis TaxID=981085 RepID=UPI000CECF3D9|nr:cytochrome c oxidase-assembly factor COX23, mitochondrial [Morus notabilis]
MAPSEGSGGVTVTAAPPYPSAARISDSPCFPQYTASLKCLEEFNSDKSKCQEHFDIYKECKKKEREARLERNRNRSLFS